MKDKKAEQKIAVIDKLDEIGEKAASIRARVSDGDTDVGEAVEELDRLVRDLKAAIGKKTFDRTAYQREYMRKKRAENPDYRPIIGTASELPDWRKPPLK
jgi:SMC interacting uncharacterized protein involved in chromosome segregation